jgi:serine phosphatase RsbU (regulator of sigma subunit)
MLLTSELVTNAIVHAGTDVEVRCELAGREVRVEVHDRHQARRIQVPGEDQPVSGRGLMFPDALADSWGVTYGPAGKQVWFTLPAGEGAEIAKPDESAEPGEVPAEPEVTLLEPVEPGAPGSPRRRSSVEDIAGRAAHVAQDAVAADTVYVLLVEDDADLAVRATAGLGSDTPAGLDFDGETITGSGVYADLGASPYNLPMLRAAGVRSLVTAPLTADGRVVGLMIATAQDANRFTEADIDRLQRVSDNYADTLERARLAELERLRRGWLGFLAEASTLLAGTLDQQMTMSLIAQLIVPRLATWCAVFTVADPVARWDDGEETRARALPAYVWHADETLIADLRALLDSLPPVVPPTEPGPWTGLNPDVAGDLSATAHRVAGDVAHVFPLVARGRGIGMLVIGGPRGARFSRDMLELTEDLAGRAALAIDNARLYEEQVDMSRTLQRSLLPPTVPDIPGLDVAVVYEPAGEHSEVGGDFYDIFRIGPGKWRFAIGDVCGTGPEAATVTGLARQTLRILGQEGYSLPRVVDRLNGLILEEGPRARFLTLLHGELTLGPSGGARLELVVAGHPPPLLLDTEGYVTAIGDPQLLLGVFPEATYDAQSFQLAPEQVLLAFTDGVTERRSGNRLLGDGHGLEDILAECPGMGAGAVAARVQRAVRAFSAEPSHDDMAIVALRVL